MLQSFIKKPNSLMSLYVSVAVFLFPALSLVVPSGYSYGPMLLLVGSIVLLIKKPIFQFQTDDLTLISLLFLYFLTGVFACIYHKLSIRACDIPLRFALAIPVYLLLVSYPPKEIFFWGGLLVGAIGSGILALNPQYNTASGGGRANGFTNHIQFGDINILMGCFLLLGCIWAYSEYKNKSIFMAFFIASLMAFMASILSLSRGGWLAFPPALLVLYLVIPVQIKKIFLLIMAGAFVLGVAALILLPDNNFLKARIHQTKTEITNVAHPNQDVSLSSFSTRVLMWENGLDAFYVHPIFGWGDIEAIKHEFPSKWELVNSVGDFNHLHNEFLDALAKRGLIGISALMLLYFAPLFYFGSLLFSTFSDIRIFAATGVMLIICLITFGLTQTFLAHNSGAVIFPFYLVIIKAYCRKILHQKNNATAKL